MVPEPFAATTVTTGELASGVGVPEDVEASEAVKVYGPVAVGATPPFPPPALDP